MRYLHTPDWHLGRQFYASSLQEGQAHILDQLVALATSEKVDDVFKGLTYLVLADPKSTIAKSEKARKLGVEVISEEELKALIS